MFLIYFNIRLKNIVNIMKEQEYNHLITTLSSSLAPINQLLYEILVIAAIYIYLERIQSSTRSLSYLSYLSNNSSSVIIIFSILAFGIDWFIWCNPIQTILFGAILLIYIRYNMSNMQLISSFINMTGEYADAAKFEQSDTNDLEVQKCQTPKIPEMVDLPYDTTEIKPYGIMAYDKNEASINTIYDAYKSDQPLETITDSKYAQIMLNELYQTPQYRNNHPPNEIDSSLANDIYQTRQNTLGTPNTPNTPNTLDTPNTPNTHNTHNISDEELLESFRHPKRQFIDNRWLSTPGIGTYNDNNLCKSKNSIRNNIGNSKQQDNKSSKDVICNLAQFGKKLEQCTNQEYTVSIDQLDKINNNEILYDEF